MKKAQVHTKLNLGSCYKRKDGTSVFDENLKQFLLEHPKAVLYKGDLRKERHYFKMVYDLFGYADTMNNEKVKTNTSCYPQLILRYVED